MKAKTSEMHTVDTILNAFNSGQITPDEAMSRLDLMQDHILAGDWTTADLLAIHQAQEQFDNQLESVTDRLEDDDLFGADFS